MDCLRNPQAALNHILMARIVELLLLGQQILHPLDLVSSSLLLIRPTSRSQLSCTSPHPLASPRKTHLVPTRIEVWMRWGPTWWTTE